MTSTSVLGQHWQLRQLDHGVQNLAQTLGVPAIIAQLLSQRQLAFSDAAAISDWLSPTLKNLPDPKQLHDVNKAVDRLLQALANKEQITVFGDYDVDGSCGAAVLIRYLRGIGLKPQLYIPDRLSEGYGPTPPAMEKIVQNGSTLMITVDTGSMAFPALEKAAELGLDVIITDHHQTLANHPPCEALVNPNRLDESGQHQNLCGAGVAFLLMGALQQRLREEAIISATELPDMRQLLDLVALATVADVVPLVGVNRIFVERGLKVLAQRRNPGLAALLQVAGIPSETVPTVHTLGFVLGPRLNAGGRLSDGNLAAKLLITDDMSEAQALAFKLHELNDERREVEQQVQSQALLQAAEQAPDPALVIAGAGWHPGVIGIVAARVKEQYYRPTFILAEQDDGILKGSGRSIPGLDLGQAVLASSEHLHNGGGHAMAAGVTLHKDQLADFTTSLNKHLQQQADSQTDVFTPALRLDGLLTPGAVTPELLRDIARLEPFGAGYSAPRFAITGARLAYAKPVGADGSHVKLTLEGSAGDTLDGIAFRADQSGLLEFFNTQRGEIITVAGRVEANEWQGVVRPQIIVEDAMAGRWQGS